MPLKEVCECVQEVLLNSIVSSPQFKLQVECTLVEKCIKMNMSVTHKGCNLFCRENVTGYRGKGIHVIFEP